MGETKFIPLQGRNIRLISATIVITLIIASTSVTARDSGGSQGPPGQVSYFPEAMAGVDVPLLHRLVAGLTENLGQAGDGDVQFYASSASGGVALLDAGVTFTLMEPPTVNAQGPEPLPCPFPRTSPCSSVPRTQPETAFFRLTFGGSNPSLPMGKDPLPGSSNFFIGNDPSGWATGVRTFREVVYPDLWDGVDLVYRVVGKKLKYDLVVRPGYDPSVIRFCAEGQVGLSLGPDGSLAFTTSAGALVEDPPVAFLGDEPSERVDCEFTLLDQGSYGFVVGPHDPAATIVIDPLVNSTFLGGSEYDEGRSVALDGDGNVLVAGYSRSMDFPNTTGAYQSDRTGGACAYVSKLDPDCSEMLFSTYFGGSDWDVGSDAAVDSAGNVYLAGVTNSDDIPVTVGAVQGSRGGGWDTFVCKLDPTGSSLVYATYLGGSGKDYASYLMIIHIQVDASGALYIASSTDSDDFPTTDGALQRTRAGSEDAYVCKVNASGKSLDYSTLLGGSGLDSCWDLAVSDGGVVYLTGQTTSLDLPTTSGSYQESHTGDYADIFVGALASDGGSMEYLTYVGNWSAENAKSIAVDSEGAVYVHGFVQGMNFPTTKGAYQESAPGGSGNPVVFKLDPDGKALEYSTYLGGSGHDECQGIAIDSEGNAYLAGMTSSTDFPTTDGCYQNIFKGSYDCYVSVLSANGSDLLMSTYVGMTGLDAPMMVTFDDNASFYVVGITTSDRFPTTTGAY